METFCNESKISKLIFLEKFLERKEISEEKFEKNLQKNSWVILKNFKFPSLGIKNSTHTLEIQKGKVKDHKGCWCLISYLMHRNNNDGRGNNI